MKIFRLLTLLFLGIILFSACHKEKKEELLPAIDYLVFGHFYGLCAGESCVEIFKLESTQLAEDTLDNYPSQLDFYEGSYVLLSQEKFEMTKDLLNFFPADLLNENEKVLGMPDAGDWGGFYIEYNYNGVKKSWLIDKMKPNVPEYLHEFMDKVTEKITSLN